MSKIKELFETGIKAQIKAGNEAEKAKVGTLRGGSTGMIDKHGNVIGTCAALAYLRYKGIKISEVDPNKELMFAGGRLNEDHWFSVLKESYDGPILCEEDIPTCWETSQGIKVTGRPDIVLCEAKGISIDTIRFTPKYGIELKQIMSVNSAYNVLINGEPQLKHLMQAAHYMWQLDCPFELWYTNRNNLDMPSWMEFRPFPKPGTEGTESLNYRYYRWGDINPKTGKPRKHQITKDEYMSGKHQKAFGQASKILPFVKGFELRLERGILFYKEVGKNKGWQQTIVKIDDIKRFYDFIGDMDFYGKVPKPALNLKPSGEEYNWKFSQYSDLGDLDPEHQQGTDLKKWVDKVQKKFNIKS